MYWIEDELKKIKEFDVNNQKKLLITLNDLYELAKKGESIYEKTQFISCIEILSILICPIIYGYIIKLILVLLNQEQLISVVLFIVFLIHMCILAGVFFNNLINVKTIDDPPIVSRKNEIDNILKQLFDIDKNFEIFLEDKSDRVIIQYTSKSNNQLKIINFSIYNGVNIEYYQSDQKLKEYILNGKLVNKNGEENYELTFFIPKLD